MGKRLLVNTGIVAVLALAFGACGGGDGGGGSPTAPSGDDGPIAATIMIDATGTVSPKDVTVPIGSRVTFVNNHPGTNHEMASDPHPTHTLCTALNTVGLLTPGQSRTSSNLTVARNCSYHDHIADTNTNLQGVIRVQ